MSGNCPFDTFKHATDVVEEVLYLPPLLSRLPLAHVTPAAAPSTSSSTAKSRVGFTESRLPFIDDASVALHRALHHFRHSGPGYARLPYGEAFNWDALRLPLAIEREWYVVAFRSKRQAGSPSKSLYEADRAAHEEAVAHGGLLLYWYGVPNDQGENLATCIWTDRHAALRALSGDKHRVAMELARDMYEHYRLERYALRKRAGEERVTVLPWSSS